MFSKPWVILGQDGNYHLTGRGWLALFAFELLSIGLTPFAIAAGISLVWYMATIAFVSFAVLVVFAYKLTGSKHDSQLPHSEGKEVLSGMKLGLGAPEGSVG